MGSNPGREVLGVMSQIILASKRGFFSE